MMAGETASSRKQRESWPLFSHKEKLSFSQMLRVWSPWLRAVHGKRGGVPRQSFIRRCCVPTGGGLCSYALHSWTTQGLNSAAQFSQRYIETKGNAEGKTQNTHCGVLEESLRSPPSQAVSSCPIGCWRPLLSPLGRWFSPWPLVLPQLTKWSNSYLQALYWYNWLINFINHQLLAIGSNSDLLSRDNGL